MIQPSNNKITLCGTVFEEPVFSHEVFGESFFLFYIMIKRLSEQTDILPAVISERLMTDGLVQKGKRVRIEGQLRSYNIVTDNKSRLQLQTFVREIAEGGENDENAIELDGFICKPPIYRVTPFSREICDLHVAVNRAYNKSDYIPSICWGRNARFARSLETGERIKIDGRLQSREYQKKLDDENFITRVAYEVSIAKMALYKENGELEAETNESTAEDNVEL